VWERRAYAKSSTATSAAPRLTTCAPPWRAAAPPRPNAKSARRLRPHSLLFVGIDVIDGFLTEINVTSPTGIRAIARLDGPDVAVKIWDVIEKKRTKG
jgi:Prokaryotic glutathione synthetase, ATP-grasp domain